MIKLPRKVLCLDWDKRTLRIVVARIVAGSMELEDAHAHRLPASVDASDPQSMGAFIAQMLQRHRVRLKKVIVDVSRERAVINRLSLPPTPLNELAAAVRFQAMRELPFPLSEAEIDYVVLKKDADNRATEVQLTAVRLDTLEQIRETCKKAGLTLARIGLRPYANMVAINHLPAMLDQRVLLLDVGPTTTEIDVICGKTLTFSRAANVSVPFVGGELVTDESRVSSKGELGELELIDSVETSAIDDLLVEITRTLQAYRATEPNAVIDQIVIAGGTGIEHSLLDAVDERFGLPTTLFDPTPALGLDQDEAVKLRSFSAVLGLGWGLSSTGSLELDFLNPKRPIPPRQTLKRRMRTAAALLGTAAIVAFSLAGMKYYTTSRKLGELTASNRGKVDDARDLRQMQNRIAEARDWDAESRTVVWLDHLLDLSQSAIAPGKQMIVSDIVFSSIARNHLTIKLQCTKWEVSKEFVDAINALEVDGQRLYAARRGKWYETNDPKFKIKTDVTIRLLGLDDYSDAKKKAREKDRKKLESV